MVLEVMMMMKIMMVVVVFRVMMVLFHLGNLHCQSLHFSYFFQVLFGFVLRSSLSFQLGSHITPDRIEDAHFSKLSFKFIIFFHQTGHRVTLAAWSLLHA